MIRLNHLSEVETAHVQHVALADQQVATRLTAVWMCFGDVIHGFAAVVDSQEPVGDKVLVKLMPVTDIVVVRSDPLDETSDAYTFTVPRFLTKAQPRIAEDLVRFFVTLSDWVNEDLMTAGQPTEGLPRF